MTALPDPGDDLAPSRDPADYGRRRMFSSAFWAMMILCLLCVLAGVVVVVLAPRLLNRPAPKPAAAPPAAAAPAAPPVAILPAATAAAPAAQPPQPGVQALSDRLSHVEQMQSTTVGAAVAALAAASLSDAADRPRPFTNELTALERVAPSAEAAALRPLAAVGAPTRPALALALNREAADIAVEARKPGPDAGFLTQLQYVVSRVVSVRRVDGRGGAVDQTLSLAQRLADDGDLEGAVARLDTLPGPARDRLASWRVMAERRIEIDRRIANLRAEALARVVGLQQGAAP